MAEPRLKLVCGCTMNGDDADDLCAAGREMLNAGTELVWNHWQIAGVTKTLPDLVYAPFGRLYEHWDAMGGQEVLAASKRRPPA